MILTIGEILVEIMATSRGDGFLEPQPLVGPYPSGAPAIFIDQAGRLGHPCAIIGCVGDDDFGRLNLERLRSDGVDVSGIFIHPELPTGSAFVRYRQDGNRDFVFNIKHSACGAVSLTPAARALLAQASHLHVMGSSLFSPAVVSLTMEALDHIRAGGGTVSFDPNIRKEMLALPGLRDALERVLDRADLFMPSGEELALFSSPSTEAEAVADLLARGVKAIVLKRGASGASYFDTGTTLRQPGFAVEEVDPTGAGDCFGAAFVSAWLRGVKPRDALVLACAAGALAVTRQGPMEGAANESEIERFLAARSVEAGAPAR